MTEEEKYYLDNLITNALTVNIEESEGQQVIDLDNLNLCAVDQEKSDVTEPLTENDFLKTIYGDEDLLKLIKRVIFLYNKEKKTLEGVN